MPLQKYASVRRERDLLSWRSAPEAVGLNLAIEKTGYTDQHAFRTWKILASLLCSDGPVESIMQRPETSAAKFRR